MWRKTGKEGTEVSEGAAADGTGWSLGRAFGTVGHLQRKGISHLNESRDVFEGDRAVGVQEAVVADFHEAGGQDVLKETADEFHCIEGHSPYPVAMGLCVPEEDGVVFHPDDAIIGDRHLEDIRGEVFDTCFRRTDGLRVDVPVKLPDFRRDLIEEAGFFHGITKLGLKEFGEKSGREIKIDP